MINGTAAHEDVEREAIRDEGARSQRRGRAWPTLRSQLAALVGQGDPVPCGIEPLDAACRGGLRPGRVVIVAGAPGASKTTLITLTAHDLAARRQHAGVLAADECATGLLVRVGQLQGFVRDDLERGDPLAIESLAQRAEGPLSTLLLVDAHETRVSIPELAAELAHRSGGAPAFMFVDSVQAIAKTPRYADQDSARGRVDAVVADLRAVAMAHRLIVFATCEVSRAFYDGKHENRGADPLASAKESGSIEYGSDVFVFVSSVPDGAGECDFVVTKNRLGAKPRWRMRPDFERARLEVIDRPAEPSKATVQAAAARGENADVERRSRRLPGEMAKAKAPIRSMDELVALLGAPREKSRQAVNLAITRGWVVRPEKLRGEFTIGGMAAEDPSPPEPAVSPPEPAGGLDATPARESPPSLRSRAAAVSTGGVLMADSLNSEDAVGALEGSC